MREIVVDLFAGGGGASTGIEQALGVPVDIAINHNPEAIRMHWLNHPKTHHLTEDVWKVDPLKIIGNRPVGLLWASPDCTHHSRAKGGQPRDSKRRCLADVVIDWARLVRPRVIMLENVKEFSEWGPLDEHGQPIKKLAGMEFNRWIKDLKEQGYEIEWKFLTACDYGVPTSRERLFLIARCDGEPIIWPQATHGNGLLPYRTAAECLNFSLPCPSIFLSPKEAEQYGARRPLADNTLRRIAKGIQKFIIECENPFIVDEKLMFLTKYHGHRNGETDGRGQLLSDPLLTQDTQNRFGLVTAFLQKYYTGVVGIDVRNPVPTVTTVDHNSLVTAYLTKFYNTNIGSDIREPLPTVTGQGQHIGEVRAFLVKYYGCGDAQSINDPMHTITTKDRFGLVMVHGQAYQIVDIGLRMLTPEELMKAHDFPDHYVYVGTKTSMVERIGNSVPPTMAKVLVQANVILKEIKTAKVG